MALILVYFPCNDQSHDQFCTLFNYMLSAINPNTQIVVGGDINARIKVRTCDEQRQVLGPYGIKQHNVCGENLLKVLTAHALQK
jgi:hypothetical protein